MQDDKLSKKSQPPGQIDGLKYAEYTLFDETVPISQNSNQSISPTAQSFYSLYPVEMGSSVLHPAVLKLCKQIGHFHDYYQSKPQQRSSVDNHNSSQSFDHASVTHNVHYNYHFSEPAHPTTVINMINNNPPPRNAKKTTKSSSSKPNKQQNKTTTKTTTTVVSDDGNTRTTIESKQSEQSISTTLAQLRKELALATDDATKKKLLQQIDKLENEQKKEDNKQPNSPGAMLAGALILGVGVPALTWLLYKDIAVILKLNGIKSPARSTTDLVAKVELEENGASNIHVIKTKQLLRYYKIFSRIASRHHYLALTAKTLMAVFSVATGVSLLGENKTSLTTVFLTLFGVSTGGWLLERSLYTSHHKPVVEHCLGRANDLSGQLASVYEPPWNL